MYIQSLANSRLIVGSQFHSFNDSSLDVLYDTA